MLFNLNFLAPELVWGIFPRLLGAVYLIAIAQLWHQVLPIAGSRGISPVQLKLRRISADYPTWQRLIYFPTLLWVNASDRCLRSLVLLGCGAALAAIYGGGFSSVALFVCWLVYLSLDIAIGLSYPWDCLLLESGFLALLLPTNQALPNLASATLPLPIVVVAYQILLFRLMMGFGKRKFWGATRRDRLYIKPFMVNIPLPNIVGWYAHHLPHWFHQASLGIMFAIEIILPCLLFVPGELRLAAAIGITGLMLGIQLTSNFGFFNVLTIVLCFPLLDQTVSIFSPASLELAQSWNHLPIESLLAILFVGGLLNFPFNSWCAQTWQYWPVWQHIQAPWLKAILNFYRVLQPFRIVHTYGVFPPQIGPALRWVPVIEGTQDGQTWQEYHYRYMPTTETSPLKFVAPYHPRLDHAIFYESFGVGHSFLSSTVGFSGPYYFSHISGMDCILQRLLEGDAPIQKLFGHCPFGADHPPSEIRVSLYMYQPTSLAEQRQTGKFWQRQRVAQHSPARGLNGRLWQQWLPEADMFYADQWVWQQRSPQVQTLKKIARTGELQWIEEAATAGCAVDIHSFWQEFVTPLSTVNKSWDALPTTVQMVRSQYQPEELCSYERILARLSIALSTHLKPHWQDDWAIAQSNVALGINSDFHWYLFLHHIIGKGQAVYEAVLREPATIQEHLQDFTRESGWFYLGIFWFDSLVFLSQKFRMVQDFVPLESGGVLPGFLEFTPWISQYFQTLTEEQFPALQQRANGEWQVMAWEDRQTSCRTAPQPPILGEPNQKICQTPHSESFGGKHDL
jgi:hypothetical protein